jgi:hypothetical protein
MPVITRNQIKKMTAVKPVTRVEQKPASISSFWQTDAELAFVKDIKQLLLDCELAPSKTERMQVSLQIYNRINDKLEKFLQDDYSKWVTFAATAYNKTSEFEAQLDTYKEVDSKLVDTFTESYRKARKFISNYFKNLRAQRPSVNNWTIKPYAEMFKNIDEEDFKYAQCSRPRRNVPIVDYTGMDTIEPESEYDGITNIWHDDSMVDSDYNPEDDEDDEEFLRTRPFITVRPKKNVEQIQPIVRSQYARRIRRINYSGMDMTEDDEGTVSVCEVKWTNRVPTYKWVKYPASQANELGDEDWCEEY